jgi:ParB family chromosome partitioning protein
VPTSKTRKPTPKKRRGVKLEPTDLTPTQLAVDAPPSEVEQLAQNVRSDGGAVLATYREPLGGHLMLLVALPVDKVEPTPFQRDVSDAHVRKLVHAMDKTRRFLDPIIAVREDGMYMTPNGNHRLTAVKELGAKSILALLVPERQVAYQILALNIEKAHNLREKSLEVVRMYHDLAKLDSASEETYALEFEEPALVTLGFGYEKRGRLSGGAYAPILRKVDKWIPGSLATATAERERRADLVLAFDDAVSEAVAKLKEKGFQSPYLKPFVVARVNPLRFIEGEPPPMEQLFAQMTKRARGLDPGRIRTEDVARTGGAPPEAED